MCNANLFDELRRRHSIPSDAALARKLDIQPSQISKMRAGYPLGRSVILRIHEYLGVPVKEIRELAEQDPLPTNTTIPRQKSQELTRIT